MWVEECTEGVCPCILDTMGQKTPNDNAVPLSTEGTWGEISTNHPLAPSDKQESPHRGIQEFRVAASPSQPPLLCPTEVEDAEAKRVGFSRSNSGLKMGQRSQSCRVLSAEFWKKLQEPI